MAHKKVIIGDCVLLQGDCFEVIPLLPAMGLTVDHVITDPPFSAKTHDGHDGAKGSDGADRQILGYTAWGKDHVVTFMDCLHGVGWIVIITDHMLFPKWERAAKHHGRTTFPPVPFYAPGRSVRMMGDGPSSWTSWIAVSRPKALHKWGTLPGGYVRQKWFGENQHMGGKPVGLMSLLVQDYSRKGDLVLDPCAGSFTTGIACLRNGRRFVGIERNPEFFDKGVERMRAEHARLRGRLISLGTK